MDPATFDFAGYYRERVKKAGRPERTPAYWDARAASMGDRGFDTPYVRGFLGRMDLAGCATLLDVGCGAGVVGLSAAPPIERVYGLDHSPAMLTAFEANARRRGVAAVAILRGWQDDWRDVPVCDIVVASRSTAVPDLEAAFEKLSAKARRRVYASYPADGHLAGDDVRRAIGRPVEPLPDWLCVVGVLRQMGFHPTLDYLPGDNRLAGAGDFDRFRVRIERLLGGLSGEELPRLAAYFEANRGRRPRAPLRWALVSWEPGDRHRRP
jgi:SAM-dependent methyltransferase